MSDKPYTERGGGAYVRLKDGSTVPEDSPEGQAALETSSQARRDPRDGDEPSAATSKKVK